MMLELVPVTPDAVKARVMFVATLCERLLKVAMPLVAVALSVPCKVPLPAPRATLTTVLSVTPLALLRRLPNWSRTCSTGCWAKATPAVALEEGWVWMAKTLADPATSRSEPRLALVERPTTFAVPLRLRLPTARGVPAVGRTRTFCQVKVLVTPLALELVTVKVSCVEVTELIATDVPLETPLILFLEEPVIFTVGAVPPVSKTKPAGALRMMVPVPTLPLAFSEYVGPVKLVKVPVAPSAEMFVPPVAEVNCAGLTAIAGLVPGLLLPSLRSVAVRVKLPLALNETVRLVVPASSAVTGGKVAVRSLELRPTVSLTVLTRFH